MTSSLAYSCEVTSIKPIDKQNSIAKINSNSRDKSQVILDASPERCANISFKTTHTRNRVLREMGDKFKATFIDMSEKYSEKITVSDDIKKAGYVRVGPNVPLDAFVCFGPNEFPILSIECEVN